MHSESSSTHDPFIRSGSRFWSFVLILASILATSPSSATERRLDPGHGASAGVPAVLAGSAVVDFAALSRFESARTSTRPATRSRAIPSWRGPDETIGVAASAAARVPPMMPLLVSPPPAQSFVGLDDIPMVDSSYIVIPPDVDGAVGPTTILEGLNNNYRLIDRTSGATIATVGTATFWAATGAALDGLYSPRTLYDPYRQRWLVSMVSRQDLLLGVSQTSDPAGHWFLFRYTTSATLGFQSFGFNQNWVAVAGNQFSGSTFLRGITLIVHYPQLVAGNGAATLISQASGTHYSSAPCVTYSATADTLYVVTHLSSGGATYQVDTITGTSTPLYTSGPTRVRPGGGWALPSSSDALPQSSPLAGASACGATPCGVASTDAQIRSAPVYRAGTIHYVQTIGLPAAGATHTAVQWTRLAAPGGNYLDGCRIEDPLATATNGGRWYAYPAVAVNALGDVLVGYSSFSSAQHPSAGYSYRDHADAAGTMRDPLIYRSGEDYYHKDFGHGSNRWGDYSKAQVDPLDDRSLWTVQEYAKARTGTDDGASGSNSSRWSTVWAKVAVTATVTITASAGPGGSITPSGAVTVTIGADQTFDLTPDGCNHVADVQVDGVSVGAVSHYTFANVQASHTIVAQFSSPLQPGALGGTEANPSHPRVIPDPVGPLAGSGGVRDVEVVLQHASNQLDWRLADGSTIATTLLARMQLRELPYGDSCTSYVELIGLGAESTVPGDSAAWARLALVEPANGIMVNGAVSLDVSLEVVFRDLADDTLYAIETGHAFTVPRPFLFPATIDLQFREPRDVTCHLSADFTEDIPLVGGGSCVWTTIGYYQDGVYCKELCIDVKVAEVNTNAGPRHVVSDADIQKWLDKTNQILCSQCCVFVTWSGTAQTWKGDGFNDPDWEGPSDVNTHSKDAAKVRKLKRSKDCFNVYFIYDFFGEQFGEGKTLGQTTDDGSIIEMKGNRDRSHDVGDDLPPNPPLTPDLESNTFAHELAHGLGLGGGKQDQSDADGVDHHKGKPTDAGVDQDNLNHASANGKKLTEKQCNRIRNNAKLKQSAKKCEMKPGTGGERDKCPCIDLPAPQRIVWNPLEDAPVAGPSLPLRPNPFDAQTTLSLSLPARGRVELRIYDVAGRMVRKLVSGEMGAGHHDVTWDGRSDSGARLQNGTYLYRLNLDGKMVGSRKVVLLRR
jgi:hypothetical protein